MIALCATSCKATRHLTTNRQIQTTDSIIVRQIVRDTTVVVETDSSMIQAFIECDSLGKAHIKELRNYQAGQRLKPPTIIIRDNILTATAKTDSLELKIKWLEKELEHYKTNTKVVTEIKTIEANRLSWWQSLWVLIGQISAVAIVLLVTYKIVRNYVR